MTIAFRPLRNPNPLGFPGGVPPGFDPTHPAAANIRMTAAMIGGNAFVNLRTGQKGSVTGAVALTTDSAVGPCFLGTGAPIKVSVASGSSETQTLGTMAQIATGITASAAFTLSNDSGGGAGQCLKYNAGTTPQLTKISTGISVSSAITIPTLTPHFVAVSWNTTTVNFVLVNLSTGLIKSASIASAPSGIAATNGSYQVGNDNAGDPSNIYTAAAMGSAAFMSIPQLLLWAADPWSFWYPRRDAMLVGAAAAAFKAYWAQQNNLPVIGAGTY